MDAVISLSIRSLCSRIRKARDHDPYEFAPPEGVSMELTRKFLRVMRAEDMSEIRDISDDDIIMMFQHGEELSGLVEIDNLLSDSNNLNEKLQNLSSVKRRRIL